MKRVLISWILSISLLSCGGEITMPGGEIPPPVPTQIPAPSSPPSAPILSVDFRAKQLVFSWEADPAASSYKIFENSDGVSGFTQMGDDFTGTTLVKDISVHRHDWANALYYVEACNVIGCTASNEVNTVGGLLESIGNFQEYNTGHRPQFGYSVALSGNGNTMVVGAAKESSGARGINGQESDASAIDSGAAYIFTLTGGGWEQQAYLKASNADANDNFGRVVAISEDGNRVVVGAQYEESNATGINGDETDNSAMYAGAAYIFERSGNTWTQQAYVKGSNNEAHDSFGCSVSISGDGNRIAVGSHAESSNATGVNGNQGNNSANGAGATYLFRYFSNTWVQEAFIKASNTEAGDLFGWRVALDMDGDTLAVGSRSEDSNAEGVGGDQNDNSVDASGAVYVFARSGTDWVQQAYVKATNTDVYDQFGSSLTLSGDGDLLAVGSKNEDSNATGINGNQSDNSKSNAGAVYTYSRSGSLWTSGSYIKASNTDQSDSFGHDLRLNQDGDILVVGAYTEKSNTTGIGGDQSNNSASNAGAAYIFTRSLFGWAQHAYVKASNTERADYFGWAVSISNDGATVTIGASGEDSATTGINGDQTNNAAEDAGAIYVFRNTLNTWSQQAYIKASLAGHNDQAGCSIAISEDGNTLAIGARYEDGAAAGVNGDEGDNSLANSGAVYIYTRSQEGWLRQAYIKASNPDAEDYFGSAVALNQNGDTLAIGAKNEDSNADGINGDQSDNSRTSAGAVYIFSRSADVWAQETYLKASISDWHDYFGSSVDLSSDGETLAVGAYGEDSATIGINGDEEDDSANSAGAVYLFTRSGNSWEQQAFIKPSNTDANDHFGSTVSINHNGNTLAVGARYEDSVATGINGDDTDNSASHAGSVYVFTRSGIEWSQQAYIKASNTEADDTFGFSVSLAEDGNTLAVGAYAEDSNATGINGNQNSNSRNASGAVYLFTRSGTDWSQEVYVKASNTSSSDYFGQVVALSGDGATLVVGAYGEDSHAIGINGDETDDSADTSGAAYLFTRSGAGWSQQSYMKAPQVCPLGRFGNTIDVSSNGDTVAIGAIYSGAAYLY